MCESLKEYCVRYDRRELLAQWHPKKRSAVPRQGYERLETKGLVAL